MSTPLYISDQQLAELGISTTDVVVAIEKVLHEIRSNSVAVAPKTGITTVDGRYLMATLAVSDDNRLIAVKSVIANERNKQHNRPAINGGIMLLDGESGELRAILDANWITSVRTAGMSAVAASRLANPESRSIGLIGAGVQAESHLRAMAELFPLSRVAAAGRGAAGLRRIQTLAGELGLICELTDADTILKQSDIVVSAVTRDFTIEPFLDAANLANGAFAVMPDLAIPWQPSSLTAFGRIYIDDVVQERSMDKPMIRDELISGDLADLVIDGRSHDPDRPAAFVFRGTAAGDLALACLAYQRATIASARAD